MPSYTLWGRPDGRYPTEMTAGTDRPSTASGYFGDDGYGRGDADITGRVELVGFLTFEAPDRTSADRVFAAARDHGFVYQERARRPCFDVPAFTRAAWHHRSHTPYLDATIADLGIPPILAGRARNVKELRDQSVHLGSLCQRYHSFRMQDGLPIMTPYDRAQILGALAESEKAVQVLHACAAASATMLDDVYAAFGLEVPRRTAAVARVPDESEAASPDGPGGEGALISHVRARRARRTQPVGAN